ncbi:FliI/YscN family ATPase [Aureliella helgolandensis]|uniref:Flagellum-specific ATP synthase n=1 Tax=Aureliella helgolandensis TaxID=2527968 RepID=A0A518GEU3_9BACT|nr:FliI/YscN family ATPase [Aureliella helgolandensis]QDV27121.1 Flagellum-specific ATP synthase [Aureliella helgolandensis]
MKPLPPPPEHVDLSRLLGSLDRALPSAIEGSIWSVGRNAIEAVSLPVPMGSVCSILRRNRSPIPAEVIGFSGSTTLLAPLDGAEGITSGDRVRFVESNSTVRVGEGLIGRVIDAAGKPIDDLGELTASAKAPLDAEPISAMKRPPIDDILTTGVRSIDSLLTLGRGQRIGIFAGSGVGKSTLLGMMARGTDAEVVVIGLVGERGREVQEYLQRELDPATRKKCVTVVATSDQPALRRVQAAMTATAIAEYFRDEGKHVLLMMDSVTRFAMAQREIGLASGEAPTTRGYPPSVFSMLPRLVERSGTGPTGSITGIYTVLVEGDDTNEPISDTLRGLLDGHFVLSRDIAQQGRYPALDILKSLSRLQHHLASAEQQAGSAAVRQMLARYRENEDLINIGAYQRGSNPQVDRAIALKPLIDQFLAQKARDKCEWQATLLALQQLASQASVPTAPPTAARQPNAPAALSSPASAPAPQ